MQCKCVKVVLDIDTLPLGYGTDNQWQEKSYKNKEVVNGNILYNIAMVYIMHILYVGEGVKDFQCEEVVIPQKKRVK